MREAEGLTVEARTVARDVAEVPRVSESGRRAPGTSLAEIEEWGDARTRRSSSCAAVLRPSRERIVHEATALATAALGEQVAGSSVALVRRRLEQELDRL